MFLRTLFGLSLLTTSLAVAQSLGYHSDLLHPEGDPAGGAWVVLVNDSDVAIEAYHIRVALSPNGSSESTVDSFAFAYGNTSFPPGIQSGPPWSQSWPIKPGGKLITITHLPPERDHFSAHGKIDTVLFSDGTFKGDKGIVHNIQAKRDGIAAAVRYWDAKLHDEHTEHSPLAVHELTVRHAQKIQGRACVGNGTSAGCEYWSGVLQVDLGLGGAGILKTRSDEENFQGFVNLMDQWQKKINANLAFQKLEIMWPIASRYADDSVWSK